MGRGGLLWGSDDSGRAQVSLPQQAEECVHVGELRSREEYNKAKGNEVSHCQRSLQIWKGGN